MITAANIHKTVAVDFKGLKHRVSNRLPPLPAGGYAFSAVCGAGTWDTLDLKEGWPNCVRCLCMP